MKYNLWDVEIGKYLGEFDREEDALADVRILIDHHGLGYAESLALGRVNDDGTILEPLAGMDLASRARAAERKPTVIASQRRGGIRRPAEMAAAWVARRRADLPIRRRERGD